MNLSFRAKLFLIVGAALGALAMVIVISMWSGRAQNADLLVVEQQLVPKLELRPKVEAKVTRLTRTLQEASSAQDLATLASAEGIRDEVLSILDQARTLLPLGDVEVCIRAVDDYFLLARDVTRRLILGETGTQLVDDIAAMQARQARLQVVIEDKLALAPREMARAFAAVRDANQRADRLRLFIGIAGLALALLLAIGLSRSVLSSLRALSAGLVRFSTGNFKQAIALTDGDELGALARDANRMAASLQQLSEQRERADWLRSGQMGLADELRGTRGPEALATQALRFLVPRVAAAAGVIHLKDRDGRYAVIASSGLQSTESRTRGNNAGPKPTEAETSAAGVPTRGPEEGLVGRAVSEGKLLVLSEVPPSYCRIASALGDALPTSLLLLPLRLRDETLGVLELASFSDFDPEVQEFLNSVSESLAMAIEAANSRARLEALLHESRTQAERLVAQEEELRVNNQELHSQQVDLRAANQALEAQRARLGESNQTLELARTELQHKADELARVSTYKSQFLANMSHELRTPLNSMLLLSHLLGENQSGNLTDKQVEHCNTIHSAGEDLLSLINQILDLAKIESGRQEVYIESIPLEHFAQYVKRRFGELAREQGLQLVVDVDQRLPSSIESDRPRLERVLTNLVGNAIKFTPRGEVRFSIEPASLPPGSSPGEPGGGCVAFRVSDTGPGIPLALQERIFRPFEQGEAGSSRSHGGTGLGLAIARESMLLLGGDLRVDSTPGQGSTFTCYLPGPTAFKPAMTEVREPPVALPESTASSSLQEPQLLLIEDDLVMCEQLSDIILARQFKVLVAPSGQEGLQLARAPGVVGIILDVRLPDLDGWTVIQRLKQDPVTRGIPVHFISAVDAPERGLALGAIGYLQKPASHAELTNVVFSLTGQAAAPGRVLVVEDDPKAGRTIVDLLSAAGTAVQLASTGREALALMATERFHCMVLDLGLPDTDGLSLLKEIQSRWPDSAPSVVVHTGRFLTKAEVRQLEAYAQTIIVKGEHSARRLLDEVRLFLQYLEQALPTPPSAPPAVANNDWATLRLDSVRILIAEDDMRTVYAISALLQGKGADVLIAEHGQDALDTLEREPDVGVVLMDIMMPVMDGYEAMRRIRAMERFQELPIIALTAKAMPGERERCVAAGATDYLSKPIDPSALLGALSRWVATRRD